MSLKNNEKIIKRWIKLMIREMLIEGYFQARDNNEAEKIFDRVFDRMFIRLEEIT